MRREVARNRSRAQAIIVPDAAFRSWLEPALQVATRYGLYDYGFYSYGLYSYGLYDYGSYSYGLYSYGPFLSCLERTLQVATRLGACVQTPAQTCV